MLSRRDLALAVAVRRGAGGALRQAQDMLDLHPILRETQPR